MWAEVAFLNAHKCGNVMTVKFNTAQELLLPQTHLVVRGSIPQHASNCERSNMNLNTALELLSPQTHLVVRGSIPQRVHNRDGSNMNLNTALELLLPQTSCPEVAFSNKPQWAMCRWRITTLRWSYFCLSHSVIRGSILQCVSNWERSNMNLNTVRSYFCLGPHVQR